MTLSLDPLLPHLSPWLLVLFRLTGIFLFAPLYASSAIPARVKVMLAFGLSVCVYPALLDVGTPSHTLIAPLVESGLALPMIIGSVLAELAIGLVIGFGASLPLNAMQLGGRMIDQQIGLGLAGVFNPDLDQETGIVSEFFFLMALAVFLILGGHRILLATLIGSFDHVPLGGFVADGQTISLIIGLVTSMFELAIRIAGPLLCLVFLESIALGFIARTVPQLNILSIGFPLRILIGVGMIISALAVVNAVFITDMRQALHRIAMFFSQ